MITFVAVSEFYDAGLGSSLPVPSSYPTSLSMSVGNGVCADPSGTSISGHMSQRDVALVCCFLPSSAVLLTSC